MACSTTKRTEATLEAAEYYFGGKHCRDLDFPPNTANALDGAYVPVNYIEPENFTEVNGYVWFNGGGSDPAPAGLTLIDEVVILSGDSAVVVAAAFYAALNITAHQDKIVVSYTAASEVVGIENFVPGAITAETDEDTTGTSYSISKTGFGDFLGQSDGGASLAVEIVSTPINADQTGGLELSEIFQGATATLSVGLQELTAARWKQIVGQGTGDFVTGASSDVVGMGESRLFQNLADLGGMLVIHPIRLDRTDRTADVVFWKTNGKLTEVNYSGADKQVGQTEWKAYLDASKSTKLNLWARGDWSQTGLEA